MPIISVYKPRFEGVLVYMGVRAVVKGVDTAKPRGLTSMTVLYDLLIFSSRVLCVSVPMKETRSWTESRLRFNDIAFRILTEGLRFNDIARQWLFHTSPLKDLAKEV